MKTFSHIDTELDDYKETIKDYVGGFDARGVPYWVCVEDHNVVGIVIVGEEPLKVIEPIGTIVSFVLIVNFKAPDETMTEFATTALNIAKDNDAAYSFIDLSTDYEQIIENFTNIGYSEFVHSIRMTCPLTEDYPKSNDIRFEKITRDDVDDFFEKMKVFMSGSPDEMLNVVLENLRGLPYQFLDQFYETEDLYYVYAGKDIVGLIDMNSKYLNIANIGVAPEHRRKGLGRMIMQESMRLLKESSVKEGRLRVDVDNVAAIQLYESLGFTKSDSRKALIWRK
ncbi:MAG: GNAT family N-acetyltransferase [Candidatus Thorarchaeota archaeon]|jgi:GNAT superfamily N-acetyltransferase